MPSEFRLTIGYQPVNVLTAPIADTGTDLMSSSENVDGAYGFAGFDMPSGFSQLPPDDDSQEINQMNVAFADMLYSELLICIDGILIYARTPRNFVGALLQLLTRDAKWCDRFFSGAGISHDPEGLNGLREIPGPATAADLQQFRCATGWMRDSLLDYRRVMRPLHGKLEEVLKVVGRTKRLQLELSSDGHVKDDNIIPRLGGGATYNAKERKQHLHIDHLYMTDSMDTCQNVLILKDGLTHFCELVACDSPTSTVDASAMLEWWKCFGAPSVLVSDQGSLFKNEVIRQVCKVLDIEQSLVVAYASWINGTIERLNRYVLQVVRVLLMEYQLDTRDGVYLIPLVQEQILLGCGKKAEMLVPSDGLPAEQLAKLRESLAAMHREVINQREKRHLQNTALCKGVECNFSFGDFVHWSRIASR
ncbi:hypothetical protein PHMEG_0008641 [Phytophthora megakarya]|uniref:Integrase catalytic domain-containing protein n=1 Tax=Phytophthora megakarya TaxID=4795 RepID=A0A225WK83_9STRA|nr:hypothetical protein PHMEG_0008641 [Phytophthora megakarya]